MPIDKHEDVLLTLKGCSSGSDDLVFELLDLPINGTVEFRAGVVSASVPKHHPMITYFHPFTFS